MKAGLETSACVPVREEKSEEGAEEPHEEIEGYEMLVGEGMESEEARNEFVDAVEKLLEFESLGEGKQQSRKSFDHAASQSGMFELMR